MITTFDIANTIYRVLSNDVDLTSSISGIVCKRRPLNSNKEDIVIGSLPVNNEQVQQAVANVNVHVPNLSISTGAGIDTTQPNTKRLKEITDKVIHLLDEKYFDSYWFYVQQQNLFEDEQDHYSNIRLNFYSENIN
jgi:hypothetical protein